MGTAKWGVENVGTIIARGILIDVAGLLHEGEIAAGRDPADFPQPEYEFTPEELERALLRQGLTIDDIKPGRRNTGSYRLGRTILDVQPPLPLGTNA